MVVETHTAHAALSAMPSACWSSTRAAATPLGEHEDVLIHAAQVA